MGGDIGLEFPFADDDELKGESMIGDCFKFKFPDSFNWLLPKLSVKMEEEENWNWLKSVWNAKGMRGGLLLANKFESKDWSMFKSDGEFKLKASTFKFGEFSWLKLGGGIWFKLPKSSKPKPWKGYWLKSFNEFVEGDKSFKDEIGEFME